MLLSPVPPPPTPVSLPLDPFRPPRPQEHDGGSWPRLFGLFLACGSAVNAKRVIIDGDFKLQGFLLHVCGSGSVEVAL